MGTFTTAFAPALNKEGFAKLTFKGLKSLSGKAGDVSEKTGEIYQKDWEIHSLTFAVQGVKRGSSQDIQVKVSTKFSEENILGRLLKNMGYVMPEIELEVDEDGFEIAVTEEDDEGFEVTDDFDLGIEEFLEETIDKVFIGKLYRPTEGKDKGRLTVDVDTIQPLVKKAK